jgi:glyoxylase-like metal-dependent hydrolase (beta-lactamase superfamily II)
MAIRPPALFGLAPDVLGIRTIMVNYFFVRVGLRDWVLIDAGLPFSGRRLMREAARRFGPTRAPLAIILTHGHFDHVGSLRRLQRRWPNVPIYAHPYELPYLQRERAYAPPDPTVGGGIIPFSSVLYPRRVGPFGPMVAALPADGSVPALPGWRWLPTPGHSPGHISLWRERDRLLIAGDAVTTTRQESLIAIVRQTLQIRPPPAYFTPDWSSAYESLQEIRALRPAIVGSGHGQPANGDFFREGLDELLNGFSEYGLPRHGRYLPVAWQAA